jgi:hypothetical protein
MSQAIKEAGFPAVLDPTPDVQDTRLPRAVFVETPPAAVRDLPATTIVGASPQASNA